MQTVSFAGDTYNIPTVRGDRPWSGLSDFVVAAASKCINTAGGNFTLLADINFGATFGLVSTYYKSRTAGIADAGQLRLANTDTIRWRNAAGDGNLILGLSTNTLQFNSANVITAGLGSIVNADINASAAIVFTKMAALTASIVPVANASGFLTSSAITATELGYLSGVSSAIQTQLAAKAPLASPTFTGTVTLPVTADRALQTGTLSVLEASAVTKTELGYVSGVTSALQTQLDAKAADSAVVKLTGDQTIAGNKTFSDPIVQNDTTNQIVLGVTRTVTISAPTPTSTSRVVTLPDLSADYSVVGTAGTQATIAGAKTFTTQLIGKGTATNDSAAAGYIGEYIESVVGNTNFPTTTQYGDLTSISLTAGDWDVTALVHINNQASHTVSRAGISVTSGNNSTGLVSGSNLLATPPSSTCDSHITVSNYRVSLSGTTTHYLKFTATYTGTIPQAAGRLSARRLR